MTRTPHRELKASRVARLLDVCVRTLKRVDYETLPFDRTDGGHRRYRESDVLQYQQRRARRTRRAHGALHDETKGE